MTDTDYTVRGSTALLDAIGWSIKHISNIHKYARPEDVPTHTLFIITTDGMENASHHYNSNTIKQMIEHQKESYGWEFLFIGANIDAVETAAQFGINRERAVSYARMFFPAPSICRKSPALDGLFDRLSRGLVRGPCLIQFGFSATRPCFV